MHYYSTNVEMNGMQNMNCLIHRLWNRMAIKERGKEKENHLNGYCLNKNNYYLIWNEWWIHWYGRNAPRKVMATGNQQIVFDTLRANVISFLLATNFVLKISSYFFNKTKEKRFFLFVLLIPNKRLWRGKKQSKYSGTTVGFHF